MKLILFTSTNRKIGTKGPLQKKSLKFHFSYFFLLQIRDGGGPFSELLGTYCGSQPPRPIVSGTNKLWIRFFSDGTLEGAGVSGTFEVVDGKINETFINCFHRVNCKMLKHHIFIFSTVLVCATDNQQHDGYINFAKLSGKV